jgi:hypothetical protein
MMWTVTTRGDLPDEYERREDRSSVHAWSDYQGRILELESTASSSTARCSM